MASLTEQYEAARNQLTNAIRYRQLLDDLAADWNTDWEMYTTDPALWETAHAVERWLWETKDNATVPGEQYQAQCDRLRQLYARQRRQLNLTEVPS